MTGQAGRPSTDPIDALVEVMRTVDVRMRGGDDIAAAEAYTLGLIMGTAYRVPLAVERFNRLEGVTDA